MRYLTRFKRKQNRGAALVLVLAFVVLLTTLVVAYFSRATSDRQFAASTFGDANADILARSAMEVIVGDFKEELIDGSTPISTGITPPTYYLPTPRTNVVAQRNVNASVGIPNLIRISLHSDPLVPPAVGSRASNINSTAPSLSGRLISASRWNKHCLIPMQYPTTASVDPEPVNTFPTPDWVYVTAQGPAAAPPPNAVIARYAYAVYDEGGLLDMNVAGFPSPTPAASPVGRKGVVTLADMRALPWNTRATPGTTPTSVPTFTAIGQIVEWRNNATVQATPASSFPSWQAVTSAGATAFLNLYLSTTSDFTKASTTSYNAGTKATDQVFVNRGELLNFNKFQGSASVDSNTLGYIGTFSRDRNVPTFWLRGGPSSPASPLSGRFLISNLDVVLPNPPTSSNAVIQQNFGLQWITYPGPTPPSRWRYVSAAAAINPAPAASDISPPTASNNDFFQLLRYARSTDTSTPDVGETLALGAAIIDQYDADAITTQIEYSDPNTGVTLVAYGMEANDSVDQLVAQRPLQPRRQDTKCCPHLHRVIHGINQ